MYRNTIALMLAATTLGACSTARQTRVESGGDVVMSSQPVDNRSIPAGQTMQVRLNQTIGTKNSKVGDTFTASVVNAVTAQNGQTVVPAGATVTGRVTGLDDSDHAGEAAAIRLNFDQISFNGRTYPFTAKVTETNLQTEGNDSRNETLKKAGIGAAAGAVLGAVLSDGDLSKILGGAAIGAAAGSVISLGTGDVEAVLPAGSTMTLQATSTVALR